MIVAKFKCSSVTDFGQSERVELAAAYGPGNEEWAKFTPSGQLTMQIDNPDARGKFKPGESYLLRFEPAPE